MVKKKAVKSVKKAKKKVSKPAKEERKKAAKPVAKAKKKVAKVAKAKEAKLEEGQKTGVSKETVLSNIDRDLIQWSKPFTSLSDASRRAESVPELTAEEEREIALASREGFNEKGPDSFKVNKAAQALFIYTLRHVTRLAYQYRGYDIPAEDLLQEGMIGLMEAIKRYDPDKKGKSNKTKDGKIKPKETARLATYASFWIRARMNDHVLKHFSIYGKIATTAAQRRLFFKLRSETAHLGHRLDIEEADKIAAKYDVKLADVLEMEKRFLPKITYEKPDSGDNDEFDASPSIRSFSPSERALKARLERCFSNHTTSLMSASSGFSRPANSLTKATKYTSRYWLKSSALPASAYARSRRRRG
ncbi:MAG: hypothetical protein ISN26_05470 [Betaproteobacteria bacterium AqS2]|uniref:RNA polymerase sigma-70 domain-containing protein n=1 Tax=Candidatus Amphirhobacter heronislandensis TaxID=1732024 RepID=A0A930UCQ5_9GAMM|nr:hypothetical protein [Betaproteobacteria bacterium AqS2]